MGIDRDSPAWLIYQRCVAAFIQDSHGDLNTSVTPNVFLTGEISGQKRQVDVLIEHRWHARTSSRIIVDAKKRSTKADIGDVEQFEGMMRDCRAARGIIVCTSGWTSGALRRAQDAITITLLDYEEALDEFEWMYEECLGPCGAAADGPAGGVLWGEYVADGLPMEPVVDTAMGFGQLSGWLILQIGKCDRCHTFHVWCWDCGDKFAVEDSKVVTCGCDYREWASIPESPESGHIGTPESIWLMMREHGGPPVAFDRRPIR